MIKLIRGGETPAGYQIYYVYNDDVLMDNIDGVAFTTARGEGKGEIYDFRRARRYALAIAKNLKQTTISIQLQGEPKIYHVQGGGRVPSSEPLPTSESPPKRKCCGRK